MTFLSELWPDDPETVKALQEWFGYCQTPDTSQQKIAFLIGPKRSGKGTIVRVLRALLGADNTAAPTLSSLGLPFGLAPLLGKTLATISDARLSGRSDLATVTERLLSISGEDGQTIERKHLPALTLTRLPIRFLIVSNELPRLSDASGALVGRLIMLRQTKSWYGKEDRNLTKRLLDELPGILLWSIAGWQRLRERGHFLQPAAGAGLVNQMEELANPLSVFVEEKCTIGIKEEVTVANLYSAYHGWAESNGHKPAPSNVFGRDLHAAFPDIALSQQRQDGKRTRIYIGIGLQPADPVPE